MVIYISRLEEGILVVDKENPENHSYSAFYGLSFGLGVNFAAVAGANASNGDPGSGSDTRTHTSTAALKTDMVIPKL